MNLSACPTDHGVLPISKYQVIFFEMVIFREKYTVVGCLQWYVQKMEGSSFYHLQHSSFVILLHCFWSKPGCCGGTASAGVALDLFKTVL